MRSTAFLLPMVLLCLTAGPLAAQVPQFGMQGALAFPGGDLADSADVGLQVGGHVRWDYGRGCGLMARVDLTAYGRKDGYNASSLGAGADFTYHFRQNRRGLYALAGLSLQNYSREVPYGSIHDNGLGVALGLGYDLDRHIGLQARLVSGQESLSSFNLGMTYSF
jgi:hypothetical protein